MRKERRWLKSAIATSADVQVSLPWARADRRKPDAMKPMAAPKLRAVAAR